MKILTNIIITITLLLFTITPMQIHTMYCEAVHYAAVSCMMTYK